ncbi:MAG: hypothetical protein IKX95_03510 [Lachnospiraceae bacterium]|nr:hypothetical protein [Lachnospiraceae bacterium]MBR5765831.1 hypothetical protein [Lachnospiraceae bacterium]MBR6485510.1 hypothetical protein [Lachnospiraceae bacterium]
MSIKDEIDIQFNRAMQQADELEELSGVICSIGSVKINTALKLLTQSWKGENALEYTGKVNAIRDRMYGCAESLKETSDLIRVTAGRIYAAEMAAIRMIG